MKYSNFPAMFAAAVFTLAVGCGPDEVVEKPEADAASPSSITASYAFLAASDERGTEVQWATALTLAAISEAVYQDKETLILDMKRLGATSVVPIFDTSNECVVASDEKSVVVAFRGTEDLADVLTDIKIFASRRTPERQHGGFYAGVDDIYSKILAELRHQRFKDKRLWVTGHSLGGALAAVFAYRAASADEVRVQGIMTFGQPLVFGDETARRVLNKFDTDYVRFVNSWDPITRCLPNYRHAGARVHLTRSDYSYAKPAVSVKSTVNGGTSDLMFFEDETRLRPMSNEEFETFEQEWNQDFSLSTVPAAAANQPMKTGASIPFFRRHQMVTYIEQIKREMETK